MGGGDTKRVSSGFQILSPYLVRTTDITHWFRPDGFCAGGVGLPTHRVGHPVCADLLVHHTTGDRVLAHCRRPRGSLGSPLGDDFKRLWGRIMHLERCPAAPGGHAGRGDPGSGVILIDFATFLFAVITLLIVHVPKPKITAKGKAGQGSLLREAAYGWTYILARHGLLGILLFFAVTNFTSGIVGVLFTPLVLNFSTPAILGMLLSIGGLGFLAGSLTMSTWGGPKLRVAGILSFSVSQGVALFAGGFPPNVAILGAAAFLFFFSIPIINGCSQAIWQSKTAPDVQGRVFAVRRMIAWSSLPLAYLISGPLADRVFEPLLAEGELLANSVGQVIGVGTGRGIGLLFMVLGVITLLATVASYLYLPLRKVEAELPDAIPDQASVTTPG